MLHLSCMLWVKALWNYALCTATLGGDIVSLTCTSLLELCRYNVRQCYCSGESVMLHSGYLQVPLQSSRNTYPAWLTMCGKVLITKDKPTVCRLDPVENYEIYVDSDIVFSLWLFLWGYLQAVDGLNSVCLCQYCFTQILQTHLL